MTATPIPAACDHCNVAEQLRPVVPGLARCSACGFFTPLPSEKADVSEALPIDSPLAPDGVVRGKYRLIKRLGEGAHGVTYLAEHQYLSHLCVVKVLPHRVADVSDPAVRRLRNEARVGYRVNHPHVVRVLDCDVLRGTWYFVMEYIAGIDLSAIIRAGLRLPWQQAVAVTADVAQGLAAIHRCDLIHRDIKPSNLILDSKGRTRVADLGVARLSHDPSELASGVPEMAGTLAYAPPDMLLPAQPVDLTTDLYSLGASLFHLLTGRLPHHSSQVFQRLIDLQCRPVQWPDNADDVPGWFREIILQLLAIEPRDRFPSADELLQQLATPGEEVRPSSTGTREELEPRGVGVVPFDNSRSTPDDDWFGFALANYVSRSLAELPGLYVVDQDSLVAMIQRLEVESNASLRERILAAGRMVGAGTVVTGTFARQGPKLRVDAEVWPIGGERPLARVHADGELADLPGLERALFERLAQALGAQRTTSLAPALARSPLLAAREKFVLGRQAFLRGDYAHAIELGAEAVELDAQFADAIGLIGICYARTGRYDVAEEHHRRQAALATAWEDRRLQVEALANLGVMYYYRGDYEAAEAQYRQAAAIADELGLRTEEAYIQNNLGFVLFRQVRPREAEGAFLRAIEAHRAYGGLAPLVGPYNGMGNVLLEQKRYAEARGYYRRALALAAEVGDRTTVGTTHMHLARCAALEGRFAEAKHEFTMTLGALEETRFWNGLARAYEYMAEMNLQLGDCDEALRCTEKRIELARQHANLRMESAAWIQKAESLRKAGRVDEAAECVMQAKRASPVTASHSSEDTRPA